MDLADVLEMAREQYNAVGDTFFSDQELLRYAYAGCQEMAREALVIERVYTTTSVASQQEYSFPTNTIAIKRVTYDSKPLKPVNMREDYALSLENASTTVTGTPQYYFTWNETLYLRPIPDTAALTIKIFSFSEPQELTSASSTLEIPSMYHTNLVDYILSRMYAKDKDPGTARMFYDHWWEKGVLSAKRWQKKRLRADQFAGVQDEESGLVTIIGSV